MGGRREERFSGSGRGMEMRARDRGVWRRLVETEVKRN